MIFLSDKQRLLFSRGISAEVKNGECTIMAGSRKIATSFDTSYQGLKQIEDEFKMRLIGVFDPEDEVKFGLNAYSFYALEQNTIFDFFNYYHSILEALNQIEDYFRSAIFGSTEKCYSLISQCPVGLANAGISEEFFISQEDFTQTMKFLSEKGLSEELKNKFIYYYDVRSLVDDTLNNVISVGEKLFFVQREMNKLLSEVSSSTNQMWTGSMQKVEDGTEMTSSGWFSRRIHSMYMDSIINIRSTLDIFTKLLFEIGREPQDFKHPVKLLGNKKYFSDLDQSVIFNSSCKGYDKTVFGKLSEYDEISILRNELIHRCFLSPNPKIYFGKELNKSGTSDYFYATCFLWDIQKDGKPFRWVNRHRFYGSQMAADHYILQWVLKLYRDLEATLNYVVVFLRPRI